MELLRFPWKTMSELWRKIMPLRRSWIRDAMKIGSSLMSGFSRMSCSAPRAQKSVISITQCDSTHAPMKLENQTHAEIALLKQGNP